MSPWKVGMVILGFASVGCTSDDQPDTMDVSAMSVTYNQSDGTVSNVQAELDRQGALEESLALLQGDVSTLLASNTALQTRVDTLETENASLKEMLMTINSDLTTIESVATTTASDSLENSTALDLLTSDFAQLSGQFAELSATLDEKLTEPRICPTDMVALSDSVCVESALREETVLRGAAIACANAGRRVCSATEVMAYCSDSGLELIDPFATTGEWLADLGGQPADSGFDASWAALGHPSSESPLTYCESVRLVGTDSSDTLFYPYRCCYDRL